ncbi:J domain-containing protein [Aureispira]|nr:J domain-containing protein [Aureispira sp.]
MKDYYDILGVNKDASLPEIQKAYKKLSLKFHPDKNGKDPFFIRHYEKITEAYNILSDDHKRYRYDKAMNQQPSEDINDIPEGPPPFISSFFASKKAGKTGDLITISWEVINTEEVYINLIGNVASNGTQTIRILEAEKSKAFFIIELTAYNSTTKKTSKKKLQIINQAYPTKATSQKSKKKSLSKKSNNNVSSKNHKKDEHHSVIHKQKNSGTAYLLVAVMFFIIIVMLYKIHSINPIF